MKNNNFLPLFFAFIFMFVTGCKGNSLSILPYDVKGELVCKENIENNSIDAIDFTFYNLAEKPVESYIVVFSIYDEDGNPCFSQMAIEIKGEVKPFQNDKNCISFDELITEDNNKIYELDFVYISKIEYKDGSVWSDPLGIKGFI